MKLLHGAQTVPDPVSEWAAQSARPKTVHDTSICARSASNKKLSGIGYPTDTPTHSR